MFLINPFLFSICLIFGLFLLIWPMKQLGSAPVLHSVNFIITFGKTIKFMGFRRGFVLLSALVVI
ncbi:hypothetical protein Gotri_011223 [Gossypium trilobum]|uniref:Uncharacterized protein n=1 Tax=Gossypium trilobum TaxID=34281 RepID=A0A7J9ETZ8_9ROSI|nr:hypothetical protein [Gossypium trilobum]